MSDLFKEERPLCQQIHPQVWLLANYFKSDDIRALLPAIFRQSPLRKMMTPMGHLTGIPFTNCGTYGWISDRDGYRYTVEDPISNSPWPELPASLKTLASKAATEVGFEDFIPDACLINQYIPGTRLGVHQDKDEKDFRWPIVSLSIGLPATFQIFGTKRTNKPQEICLYDGDVVVWGGDSRLIYHAIKTIKPDPLDVTKTERINITLRRAG